MPRTESEARMALSCRDVAALLRVSTRQVWRLCSVGELPRPARVGKRPRWDKTTLETWWAAQQEATTR